VPSHCSSPHSRAELCEATGHDVHRQLHLRANAPPPHSRLHDGEGEHLHELSEGERGALRELIWKVDNVELTTVGIDIGSSTSHLMFSRLRLQRRTQALSSQFVVIERTVLWRSPILLTPFVGERSIDAAQLGGFIARAYRDAGLAREDIDSGAVILTGEAIRRDNARAIGRLFAAEGGRFVCASAGHRLECLLAAHGSGAVELSRRTSSVVLNVDVGGGTTKLAWVHGGEVVASCAFAVGGRLVAWDGQGRLVRIDSAARRVSDLLGLGLQLGERPAGGAIDRLVDALAEAAIDVICRCDGAGLARELMVTDAPGGDCPPPDLITFSGGVAEYIYGRERALFGDIARPLAERIAHALAASRLPGQLRDPGQGIRATVIGASQFSVQLSGKTIHCSRELPLPLCNVPVVFPDLPADGEVTSHTVAMAIGAAVSRAQHDPRQALALALRWRGEPLYQRLRVLAEGIALSPPARTATPAALVLMMDGDVGRTLGHIVEHELGLARPLLSIDGLALKELDYVDIGRLIEPSQVLPVVIKSLLFAPAGQVLGGLHPRLPGHSHH